APDMPPDLPWLIEMVPEGPTRALLRLLVSSGELGRPFVASLTAPPERLSILRAAFDATVRDPAFVAEAERLRQPVSPSTAQEALAIVEIIYAAPDDVVAAARKIVTR